jgi:hypothetical protein
MALGVGLLLACFAVAGAVLYVRDRRERARAADEVFWVRTLLPVLGLKGSAFTQAVTKLAAGPLLHPVLGARRYSRRDILRQAERVRRMRLDRLVERADKYQAHPEAAPLEPGGGSGCPEQGQGSPPRVQERAACV